MNTSKGAVTAYSILGKILSLIGYIGFLFFLIGGAALISEGDSDSFIVCLVLMAVFFFLIIKGSQMKRRIKRFRRYISLISKERITSLVGIASRTSRPIDFVKKDLQKMIDKKFFFDAYLDLQRDEIIINNQNSTVSEVYQPVQTKIETETVKCPGCGAANARQKGKFINCEYCGSLIG